MKKILFQILFVYFFLFNSFLASSDLLSADNLCKQFVPRLGPTESKPFDTLHMFLKECFERVNFQEKICR